MKRAPDFFKNSALIYASISIAFSIVLILSLFSYTSKDIAFLSQSNSHTTHNIIGIAGAYFAFVLRFLFGRAAYFIPFCLIGLGLAKIGILRFYGISKSKTIDTIAALIFIVSLSAFMGLLFAKAGAGWEYSDGVVGFYLSQFFESYLGFSGSLIVLSLILIIMSLLFFGFFFVDVFKGTRLAFSMVSEFIAERRNRKVETNGDFLIAKKKKLKDASLRQIEDEDKEKAATKVRPAIKPEIKMYTPKINQPQSQAQAQASKIDNDKLVNKEEIKKQIDGLNPDNAKTFDPKTYKLPSIGLLKVPSSLDYREVKEDVEASIKNLEETLSDFGVEAKVVSVQKGPVVTMYELEPSPGVKITKISALSDDIALSMKSSSVRIVAPIPGRGTVGVEVPNEKKHLVYLREILEEKIFSDSSSKLTLTIGKDVSGNPVIADLKEMPHLLIAGTTGSGKTVCVNTIITSILFKAKPDEVKFILVDPKMVELAPFAGIPHLLHPIIYESKKAFITLNWAVEEMERRYHLLASEGARNIDVYNKSGKKMPFIIIIVDELADLMVVAKESIEVSIQRLAQLSRAVGIHLILATQRPSVDVITGVIKANFPARISFKVSSKVDSRTVLDVMGADKLLGKGDLLFLKPGAPKLIRAQGSLIDDEDINNLITFIKNQGGPVYEAGILEGEKKAAMHVQSDELIDEAVKTILQARQASASILQRRLRVGYTRAARLLDLMEQQGIVGPFCGSKAREILVDPQDYLKEKEGAV
ncbi:MAG: DNA translocase FtsK [Candidatus Omnitrophota bacterium]|jgi:S-DNA-T family DNA segregation ATPase FtsK/SpoIIIE